MAVSNKININWPTYLGMITQLSDMIRTSGLEFDNIYGVPRGGLIPAVILSHRLEVSLVTDLRLTFGRTLLIDDISDTGDTLTKTITQCQSINVINYIDHIITYTATLYKHVNTKVIPDFYVRENKDWVVFPYEK